MTSQLMTHRRVLQIALPIVISNATVPILGAVDTAVVGQIGEAAPIGAVGIGAVILTSFYWIFGFLRMGTAGLAAQAEGADDQNEVSAILSRALLIGGAAGLGLILLQVPLFWAGFFISPASAEVESLARDYMSIRIWSAPATIAIYGITGWLIALERTRAVLVIQVAMNGANILLDLVFVLGFDWGVSGVAWASFFAEWGGLAIGLWFCRDVLKAGGWNNWAQIVKADRLKHMASVSSDILIRTVLLQAIFVSFLMWGAKFGDVPLAANQVLLQFLLITSFAMDGFAYAAEALVGQAIGAKQRSALRRAAVLTLFWAAIVGGMMALGFAIVGPVIIDLMAKDSAVQAAARVYLPYMVAAPLVGCVAWMLDGIFIGATRTADMRNMMIISALIYFVAVIPLMAQFGNHGLWTAMLLSFVVRGVTLGSRYPALEQQAT